MIKLENGCKFDNWLKTIKAIAGFIEEYGFTVDQAIEILKLQELESLNDNIKDQAEQLDRLNENIESMTGTFQNRTFLNVVASVHEE
jgi:hypothetical protein